MRSSHFYSSEKQGLGRNNLLTLSLAFFGFPLKVIFESIFLAKIQIVDSVNFRLRVAANRGSGKANEPSTEFSRDVLTPNMPARYSSPVDLPVLADR